MRAELLPGCLRSTNLPDAKQPKDGALLIAAILSTYDLILQPEGNLGLYSHMRGIYAILLASPKDKGLSELVRAVLIYHWPEMFQLPVALGTASQFEERRWLDAETPNQSNNYPGGVVCLAKLYEDLFILLPRLIALMRETRNGDMTRAQEASELATTVLALTDQPAENQLLHRVTVKKTNHPADAYLVPFSMHFGYNGEFAATIYYWQTRILAHRLCLKLYELSIPLSRNLQRNTTMTTAQSATP